MRLLSRGGEKESAVLCKVSNTQTSSLHGCLTSYQAECCQLPHFILSCSSTAHCPLIRRTVKPQAPQSIRSKSKDDLSILMQSYYVFFHNSTRNLKHPVTGFMFMSIQFLEYFIDKWNMKYTSNVNNNWISKKWDLEIKREKLVGPIKPASLNHF